MVSEGVGRRHFRRPALAVVAAVVLRLERVWMMLLMMLLVLLLKVLMEVLGVEGRLTVGETRREGGGESGRQAGGQTGRQTER